MATTTESGISRSIKRASLGGVSGNPSGNWSVVDDFPPHLLDDSLKRLSLVHAAGSPLAAPAFKTSKQDIPSFVSC